MRNYVTYGPFELRFNGSGARKYICKDRACDFWDGFDVGNLPEWRGVYVFGIRAGKGYTPVYVGKATKTFRQEALTPAKRDHYNTVLHQRAAGTPIMFFVVAGSGEGRVSDIDEIEQQLIQLAKRANPELRNNHHAGEPPWEVDVLGGRGRPTHDAVELRRMLKL